MLITHQLVFHTGSLDIRKLIANRMMIPVSLLNVGFKSVSFQNHQRNRTLDVEKSTGIQCSLHSFHKEETEAWRSQSGSEQSQDKMLGFYLWVLSHSISLAIFFSMAAFHDAFWGEDFPWAGCSVGLAGESGVACFFWQSHFADWNNTHCLTMELLASPISYWSLRRPGSKQSLTTLFPVLWPIHLPATSNFISPRVASMLFNWAGLPEIRQYALRMSEGVFAQWCMWVWTL